MCLAAFKADFVYFLTPFSRAFFLNTPNDLANWADGPNKLWDIWGSLKYALRKLLSSYLLHNFALMSVTLKNALLCLVRFSA